MTKLKLPKTIEEVGIHLQYMAEEITKLGEKIDDFTHSAASKEDHIKLEARVTALEKKDTIKQTLLWVGLVASAIINIVMVYKTFSGN